MMNAEENEGGIQVYYVGVCVIKGTHTAVVGTTEAEAAAAATTPSLNFPLSSPHHKHHMTSLPQTSHHITSHQITSHPSHHITSHYITSHHIHNHNTSHHITSHHITLHYITSHYITSYHITSHSHHITSHHITSHHITSHHITSHHIMLGRSLLITSHYHVGGSQLRHGTVRGTEERDGSLPCPPSTQL